MYLNFCQNGDILVSRVDEKYIYLYFKDGFHYLQHLKSGNIVTRTTEGFVYDNFIHSGDIVGFYIGNIFQKLWKKFMDIVERENSCC